MLKCQYPKIFPSTTLLVVPSPLASSQVGLINRITDYSSSFSLWVELRHVDGLKAIGLDSLIPSHQSELEIWDFRNLIFHSSANRIHRPTAPSPINIPPLLLEAFCQTRAPPHAMTCSDAPLNLENVSRPEERYISMDQLIPKYKRNEKELYPISQDEGIFNHLVSNDVTCPYVITFHNHFRCGIQMAMLASGRGF